MSNTYFQFKQFRISQGDCAMKVTTDACILGAWTPALHSTKRILDIGTGTGLLALMMAQKHNSAVIKAIELDAQAAEQARANVLASVWADRINIKEGDVKEYASTEKYDLIISNPPFFNNSLLSENIAKNNARHTDALSYEDLFAAIERNLADDGIASVLLPMPEANRWEALVTEKGWFVVNSLSVKHRDNAVIKRKVIVVCRQRTETQHSQLLVIQNQDGTYMEMFAKLMAPWYLNL